MIGGLPGVEPMRTACALGLMLAVTACGSDPTPDAAVTRVRAAAADLARDAEQHGRLTVVGRDGWLFFVPELRHLTVGPFWDVHAAAVSRARSPEASDPLPAILDFKRQLDGLGVELVLVPVPAKAAIYPDRLPVEATVAAGTRIDPDHQRFYERLRDDGLEVLDLTAVFLDRRDHPEGPLYCRTDTHWSGVGCVVAAERIAATVGTRSGPVDPPDRPLATAWASLTITGDLVAGAPGDAAAGETLRVRRIGREGDPARPIPPDPESPVVLLGDSHTLVFQAGGDMHATGAGLADQLVAELGLAVDLVGVRGAGATAARVNLLRRAQRDPSYWSRKQLVIWVFAARELTESDGWSLVPITP